MIVALLVAFFSLIALMVIHEYGHFVVAKKFGVRVDEFGIGYPPRLFGMRFGETLYSVNLVPLGAFVKIYGEEGGVDDYRSFSKLAIWKRILIVLGGVISFWIASAIIFSIVFVMGVSVPIGDQDISGISSTSVTIISVAEDSPARDAGIMSGDEVVGVKSQDGEVPIHKISEFKTITEANRGKEVTVNVRRDGKNISLVLTPRLTNPEGQGATGVVLERIGNVIEKTPWYAAPAKGVIFTVKTTWQALAGIYGVIANLVRGQGVPAGAELAGPVGITIFLSQAANLGVGFFLYFIGSLSVLLALFNVFPIPALDGGKLLFLIIEGARRRPVSVRVEQTLTIIFFALLIIMSIFVTIKFDIPRVVDLFKAAL